MGEGDWHDRGRRVLRRTCSAATSATASSACKGIPEVDDSFLLLLNAHEHDRFPVAVACRRGMVLAGRRRVRRCPANSSEAGGDRSARSRLARLLTSRSRTTRAERTRPARRSGRHRRASTRDDFGVRRVVSPETQRALLGAMGFDAGRGQRSQASRHVFESATRRSRLEPVVVPAKGGPVGVTFAHAAWRRGDPRNGASRSRMIGEPGINRAGQAPSSRRTRSTASS